MILRFTILFVLGFRALGHGQTFTQQVYVLAESFLEDKCKVFPECDCCSTDLIFLTNKTFAMVSRCLYNDAYLKGSYSVKNNTLVLKFKQKGVNEIYNEEKEEFRYEMKDMKLEPIQFSIVTCGVDKIRLQHATVKDFKNGSRLSASDEKRIFAALKKSEAWKLISN